MKIYAQGGRRIILAADNFIASTAQLSTHVFQDGSVATARIQTMGLCNLAVLVSCPFCAFPGEAEVCFASPSGVATSAPQLRCCQLSVSQDGHVMGRKAAMCCTTWQFCLPTCGGVSAKWRYF